MGFGGFIRNPVSAITDPINTALSQAQSAFAFSVGGTARAEAARDAALQRQALAALIAKPLAIPRPDDRAIAAARRRSIAAMLARHGRASTILSDAGSGDALGA